MGESSKTPLMNQHQPHQPSPSKERAEYAELMFKVGFNLLPNLDHAEVVIAILDSTLYSHLVEFFNIN